MFMTVARAENKEKKHDSQILGKDSLTPYHKSRKELTSSLLLEPNISLRRNFY